MVLPDRNGPSQRPNRRLRTHTAPETWESPVGEGGRTTLDMAVHEGNANASSGSLGSVLEDSETWVSFGLPITSCFRSGVKGSPRRRANGASNLHGSTGGRAAQPGSCHGCRQRSGSARPGRAANGISDAPPAQCLNPNYIFSTGHPRETSRRLYFYFVFDFRSRK